MLSSHTWCCACGGPRVSPGLGSVFLLLKRSGGLFIHHPLLGARSPWDSQMLPRGLLPSGSCRAVQDLCLLEAFSQGLPTNKLIVFIFSKSRFLFKLLLSSACSAVWFMFLVI